MNPTSGAPATGRAIGAWRLGSFGLALVWSAGIVYLGQEWHGQFGDGSRLAIACTPWVVIAGWPSSHRVPRDWHLALGLALPVLALAAWFDLRLGLGPGRLQAGLAAALVMSACLGEARTQASRGLGAVYGFFWFLCMGFLPAAAVAVQWGRGELVSDEGLSSALRAFSPVASIWRDVQPIEGDLARSGLNSAFFCPATLVCMALAVVFAAASRRKPRENLS